MDVLKLNGFGASDGVVDGPKDGVVELLEAGVVDGPKAGVEELPNGADEPRTDVVVEPKPVEPPKFRVEPAKDGVDMPKGPVDVPKAGVVEPPSGVDGVAGVSVFLAPKLLPPRGVPES